jgi:hypothetical protein
VLFNPDARHAQGHTNAAYSMENSDNQTRHNTNAIVTEQDLADSYFPAFISCANRGNASGIMCSYNAVK